MAKNKTPGRRSGSHSPLTRDWAYLQAIRDGRQPRAVTFTDRRKEVARRSARGKATVSSEE